MQKWRLLTSEKLIANQWISVRRDQCLTQRRTVVDGYYVVEKSDFAMAVALTKDSELLLVRQYKHPVGEVIVECPAGYVGAGEEPAAAIVREVREETGYQVGNVEALGVYYASPGVMNARAHLFLCTDLVPDGPQSLDSTEDVELVVVDFAAAMRHLTSGRLVFDLASVSALLLAQQKLVASGRFRVD